MFEMTTRKKVAAGAVAVFAVSGTAFAYWTATGSGTGTAQTDTAVGAVTVVQTTPTGELAPGVPALTLGGTFTNPNDGPVHITALTVTGISVTKATGVSGDCDATDYTVGNSSPLAIGREAVANDTTTWSGITLAFVNKETNQDACKGATVTLSYTTS